MTWTLPISTLPSSKGLGLIPLLHSVGTPTEEEIRLATEHLLERARALVEDRVYPRLPLEAYLDALLPVLRFVSSHQARFSDAYLGLATCAAVEGICENLQALPYVPLHTLPQDPEPVHALVSTAALLLRAYQEAVRRVVQGRHAMRIRAAFGLNEPFHTGCMQGVTAALALFLQGAQAHPLYVTEAGLSTKQLRGLEAHLGVMQGWIGKSQESLPAKRELQHARVLHAAVEYFFDRFAAITGARFLDKPQERLRGLHLVPRPPENKRERRRSAGKAA